MRPARLLPALLIAGAFVRLLLPSVSGLSAQYFTNDRFAGTPVLARVDREIGTPALDAAWLGDPPAAFSVRWQGYIEIHRPGLHVFSTRSDDGSRVTIGDRLVIDNGGSHVPLAATGAIALEAGLHRILIEYVQNGGGYEMRFSGAPAGWRLRPQRAPDWALDAARALDLALALLLASAIGWAGFALARGRGAGARRVSRSIAQRPRAAALAFFVLLAVAETWPLARHPVRLSRNDNHDTILNEWVLAWVAHQAPRAPAALFDANIFHPERDTLAYSESMIVQSAMAAPLLWCGASPVFAYNAVLLAGFALTGWSMCLVIARWTSAWMPGLVAGTLAAFNAYTMTNLPHLQSLHVEFLPPSLLALDVLLRDPRPRQVLRLAGWFTLQALTSIYLLVFAAFALAAGAAVRPEWRRRRVAAALCLAAAAAAAALLPFLLPYWRVHHVQGFTRTLDWQARMSANWRDYLTTPGRIHYALWGHALFWNLGLFPGVTGLSLAAVALVRRTAFSDRRARMCLAAGLCGLVLSFGPAVPGYGALYAAVPLLHAVRAVSRFGFLALFAIAALAGFGLADLRRATSPGRWRALAAGCLGLAVLEPLAAPLSLVRAERVSPIYARVALVPGAVVAEVPFYGGGSAHAHATYMLNGTAHWKPMVNGYSGVEPASFVDRVNALAGFPDARALDALRQAGVTHVFVHPDGMPPGTLDAIGKVPALREIDALDGIVLYELTSP
ncbi:MAG: hypothetical protein IT176_00855 [Acidobacteria bacterium]|nr:hypothetical protein [Acidobacteriota bacterium]